MPLIKLGASCREHMLNGPQKREGGQKCPKIGPHGLRMLPPENRLQINFSFCLKHRGEKVKQFLKKFELLYFYFSESIF